MCVFSGVEVLSFRGRANFSAKINFFTAELTNANNADEPVALICITVILSLYAEREPADFVYIVALHVR